MAQKLKSLRLNRCDLVDQPANPHAIVVLHKRNSSFIEKERAMFSKMAETPETVLISMLKQVLASSYHLYLMAHAAHWNVEGPMFPSWHAFFGEIYEDVHGAIDSFAESIRQHGAYAPTTFSELLSLHPEAKLERLIPSLIAANGAHMGVLKVLRLSADQAGDEGLANFCQERMAKHLKYDWQLRSMDK